MNARHTIASFFLIGLLPMLVLVLVAGPVAAQPSQAADGIQVISAQNQLRTVVGEHFSYSPEIVNLGSRSTDTILAHLNVASLTRDVYVDPEDWSSSRSIEIPPLEPGGRTSLSWDVQAVSAGSFAVYVVLLPTRAASSGTGDLVVSPPVHVSVAGRQTLNAGGSLPVVIALPVLLAAGQAALIWSRRKSEAQPGH